VDEEVAIKVKLQSGEDSGVGKPPDGYQQSD
jgi:hypothetical protein